jgi:peptidoglycan hydrolase-like protein with peptidoglycan-binding domain
MDHKEQFIADLYPAAAKVSQETGMSKELILAQAALETGWGEKVLPGTNNIFNIKASPDWHGPTKTFLVPEFEHGKRVMVNAEFRVYGSVEESLNDRVKFLQENSRYAKSGLFDPGTKGNLEKEANALQKAGYATDPKYAEQLAAVYNGPTMQPAIKQAQEPPAATEHRQTTPGSRAKTESHDAAAVYGQGDNSVAVRQLQTDLSHLGYTGANGKPLKADGDFGPATQAAVEAFQRDHHLAVDGKAGPKTLEVLHTQTQSHAKTSLPGLDNPKNPDHALYEQALAGVRQLDAQAGRASDQHSANLAAALVVEAKKAGMTRIDHVALSTDGGTRVFAVQTDSSVHKYANVPTLPSLNTPIEKSSAALQQMNQQQSQNPPTALQAPAQAQPAPAMSR